MRLSSPNSCQLSQKLWKYNIFGISASSSEGIEIDPTVSELLGGGGGGDGTGSTSLQPRFNLKKTKLKKLSRKMLKLGVNVGYSNHVIFFFFARVLGCAVSSQVLVRSVNRGCSALESQMIWIQVA